MVISILCWLLFLSGAFPLWRAWHRNRRTSLAHALLWTVAAWLAWGAALAAATVATPSDVPVVRYLALALTGCAGVAVLGARRPGADAWNFVVLSLLAVFGLPLVTSFFVHEGWHLGPIPALFLAATLAVGILNHLPTRLGWAMLLLAVGSGWEIIALVAPASPLVPAYRDWPVHWLVLAGVPWAAYLPAHWQREVSEFDRRWLDFRDRYGMVWGQRLRDQFNRAAAHARWSVELGWSGMRQQADAPPPDAAAQAEMLDALTALMKRFGTT